MLVTTSATNGRVLERARWRRVLQLLGVVCGLWASACVTSPQSNTDVDADTTRVTFTGVIPHQPDLRVRIQVKEAGGGWTTLSTARVRSDDTWTASVRVPDRSWMGECGSAVFRAIASDGTVLKGSDAECLAAAGPSPTIQQQIDCGTPEITLNRGGTHTGDVAIVGQEQAEAFGCVTEIDGNLTVNSGDSHTISLPRLARVTGDVEITLNHQQFLIPDGMGDATPETVTGQFDAPLLQTINGNLLLTNFKSSGTPSGSGYLMHFGMNALTQLDGDLTITATFFQIHMEGLNALAEIPGDFRVNWFGTADMDETTLLSGLTSVGGNVSMTLPPNARVMVENLQHVGGDLTLEKSSTTDAGIGDNMATALVSVGGNFTLNHVRRDCSTTLFPDLSSVGGMLSINGGSPSAAFGGTGASALEAGGLEIASSNLERIPFAADFSLTSGASLSVTGNPNLCQCAVDDFVSALVTAGWAGTATTAANGASAACTPTCPTGCS